MFRVLDYGPNEQVSVRDGSDAVAPPPLGVVRWVDVEDPTGDELAQLRERFNFHPLSIGDCARFDSRPKLDEFRDHLFVVTQGLTCNGGTARELGVSELHAFLGERYLVTVHTNAQEAVSQVWNRCALNPSPLGRGADFAYYLVASALTDLCFPILDRVSDELSEIEDRILDNPKKPDLERIFELRRLLATMRKVIGPQRDTMALMARQEAVQISERTGVYLRDVAERLSRLRESIEMSRELLNTSIEGHLSATSIRTNEVMKSLTLLSAVFLPLTFIVGYFGQNFEALPGVEHWTQSRGLSVGVLCFCLLTPPAMLAWFRAKQWL
jgi:magnesium transporter